MMNFKEKAINLRRALFSVNHCWELFLLKSMNKGTQTWLTLLVCSLLVLNTKVCADSLINATFVNRLGAVCTDGSPLAYFYHEGSGNGSSNWIVYLQGGGWCTSTSDCFRRSKTIFGSSRHIKDNQTLFSGLLDTDCAFNPDFYNWHKVSIYYCDGSSFMSNVEKADPVTGATYRGARIFNVVMEDMLARGMGNAQNAILAGGSAGGLATILHCDNFRALLPNTSRVKCISDSGFFIHGKDLPGVEIREQRFFNVVTTHELANSLPKSCTSKMFPGLCLFPEYLVEDIRTPLFLIESAFDSFQIGQNLVPAIGGTWNNCINISLAFCNSTQIEFMKAFRTAFIKTLLKLNNSSSRGMFVDSCYVHGHVLGRQGWTCSSIVGNNQLANKTFGQAVADWFFDRSSFQEIDTQNDSPRNCSNNDSDAVSQKCLSILPDNGSCQS